MGLMKPDIYDKAVLTVIALMFAAINAQAQAGVALEQIHGYWEA
jgi:hypothetical protein